jgi:hypothetical protein
MVMAFGLGRRRCRGAIPGPSMPDWECVAVRQRLSEDRDLNLVQSSHVGQCRDCQRASQRLSHAAAPVDMAGFVPGAHVAQALAGKIPGFAAHAVRGRAPSDSNT